MTLADRYTFGDREHTALRMVPPIPDMRVPAKAYLDAGYEIVPLLPGTKELHDTGWQERVYTLDDVRPDSNLGTKCISPVVDIDCLLALKCADDFLPTTHRIDGRPGKPRSHRAYVAELKAEDFRDLDGTMLVQILAGRGKQAVVPPSLHESGERRVWADGSLIGPPAKKVDAQFLRACVVHLAAVALIARHWPKKGTRRELRLAYARVLLETLKLEPHVATRILEWACRLGGSDEGGIRHAASAVRDTKDALDKGEPAIGAATVAKLLPTDNEGQKIIAQLRKWFGKTSEIEEAVEKVNATYFLIDVGTETVVGEEVAQSDKARQWTVFRFRSFGDFRKKFVKFSIRVGTKTVKGEQIPIIKQLADVWLKHPQGIQYDRLVYAPEGSRVHVGPRDLNGWRGFTVPPAPGAWTLTRDTLIKHVMCRNDVALFEWTLDWMADLFQRPGLHAETALVLTGPQGVGKNVIGDMVLGRSFDGRHARVTTHTKQVLGEFNDILSGLCLLVLDEVGINTEAEYNATKGLITGHTLDINRKNITLSAEDSMLHLVFLSNRVVPLPVAVDDRRCTFYDLDFIHKEDITFFAAIERELDGGGRAAMLHELLSRTIDRDRLRLAPDTKSKQLAKRENWTHAQWFIYRMMRDVGEAKWKTTELGGKDVRVIAKDRTAADYAAYVHDTKSRREVKDARTELHRELKRLMPEGFDFNRPTSVGNIQVRDFWTLPDWQTFHQSFALAVGCSVAMLFMDEHESIEADDDKHFADADEDNPTF
jgi:hypothetical protein